MLAIKNRNLDTNNTYSLRKHENIFIFCIFQNVSYIDLHIQRAVMHLGKGACIID